MRRLLSFLLALLFLSHPVTAAEKEYKLGMVTGPKTGTYFAFGNDIARLAKESGIKLAVKESNGSIDNIKRITSGENAALGIVQSDVLGFLSRSQDAESKAIAANLRIIFPLYHEEVHVFARKSITTFSDLQGKRVVVGEEGSGSQLTAVNLFSLMNITPAEMIKIAPPEGVVAVLQNKADAMIFIGGKPVRFFSNLSALRESDSGVDATLLDAVHFVPLTDEKMLAEYTTSMITQKDYTFITADVPTIAVTSALISYDFSNKGNSYEKTRCKELWMMGDIIRKHIDTLKQSGHPKWNEVNLDAHIGTWKRDKCSADTSAAKHAPKQSALEKDLLKVVRNFTK
jgi:TRAP transporter TAXI family solute receptor